MSEEQSATWLGDGEKYALLGLNLKSDQAGFVDEQLSPELAVLTRAAFKMPSHWRDWLGSIRAEEVEDCDLFILSKLKSKQPGVWMEKIRRFRPAYGRSTEVSCLPAGSLRLTSP